MRALLYVFAVAGLAVLLAACGNVPKFGPFGGTDRVVAEQYAAPYEAVYSAIVAEAEARRWRLTRQDEEGGLITAETPEAAGRLQDSLDIVLLQRGASVRVEVTSGKGFVENLDSIRGFLAAVEARL